MPDEEASAIPNDFHHLDDGAKQPAAKSTEPKNRRLWLGYLADKSEKPSRSQKKAIQSETIISAKEKDDGPDDYNNLDELADPPPIDPEHAQKAERLEDCSNELPEKHLHTGEPGRQQISRGAVRLSTALYTVSHLILFSIFGTLARLGLQALTFYPGAPVQTGLLWANVGGTLIMGYLSADQKLFHEPSVHQREAETQNAEPEQVAQEAKAAPSAAKSNSTVRKKLPLYIGLATGFCGSFTSFSSFMRDAFYALANALPVPINHPSSAPTFETLNVHRNPGYSVLAALAIVITTVGLCLSALQVGAHLALGLQRYVPSVAFMGKNKMVNGLVVFLAWGCWLGAIFMAIFPPDRSGGSVARTPSTAAEMWRSKAIFALVFAPLGCLLRFYVSLHLNGRIKAFPLGTFAVNVLGSALQAIFIDLERTPMGGLVGCQVLQGMEDGFCGCLTTVSTWISELKGLRIGHAYWYGGVSVGVGLSFMIVIMGSLLWTKGFVDPLCTA